MFHMNIAYPIVMGIVIGVVMVLIADKQLRSAHQPALQFWAIKFCYIIGSSFLTMSILVIIKRLS